MTVLSMKNIFKYIFVSMAAMAVCACAKPAEEFLHTDNKISSIWIIPATDATRIIYGEIDDSVEPAVITFGIPRTARPYFPDLSQLKVKAIVGYDAFVSPSLLGIKDLSSDFHITVTASQTGEVREYILRAEYLSI